MNFCIRVLFRRNSIFKILNQRPALLINAVTTGFAIKFCFGFKNIDLHTEGTVVSAFIINFQIRILDKSL
jgi:hypothetical protein